MGSKNQRYGEAASLYESCAASASFAHACQWGLTLYKAGRLQDSYKGRTFSTGQDDFRTATKVGRFLQGRMTSGQLQR